MPCNFELQLLKLVLQMEDVNEFEDTSKDCVMVKSVVLTGKGSFDLVKVSFMELSLANNE